MIRYVLAFVLISPLLGIIMMEQGAYSFAAHEVGYYNGASIAYLGYIILFCIFYKLAQRIPLSLPKVDTLTANYNTIAVLTLLATISFLFIILFFFGGYRVLIGQVEKGEFRTKLGFFGPIAHLMTKLFLPSLLVLNVFYFKKCTSQSYKDGLLLIANFLLAFIFGASWGYKSASMFILVPALLILYQNPKFWKVFLLFVFALASFVAFSMFFDKASEIKTEDIDLFSVISETNPIESVLYRITVLQGDVCWKMWDLFEKGELADVSYIKTLYPIIGDGNLDRFFGINQSDYFSFVNYHFGTLLTYLSGNHPALIAQGFNVTGTVFSEGLIAGGIPGIIFFSAFAGTITAIVARLIFISFRNNMPIITCMAAAYFGFNIFPWLNGGGVEALFHISVFFGLAMDLVVLLIIINLAKRIKL